MFKVLIVASDNQYAAGLSSELIAQSYAATQVADFKQALESMEEHTPDMVLVCLEEPGLSQTEVRRLLEAAKGKHVSFLALVNEEGLAQYDFTSGIDDFAIKSGSFAEVIARIKQIRWRRDKVNSKDIIKHGDLVIDLVKYEVTLGGTTVPLTFTEYELLKFLASNGGRVLSREALLSKAWGYDYFGGTRPVDVHIRKLRSKIEDSTHSFIETVRNVGYRFKKSE